MTPSPATSPWFHRYALLTAAATLALVGIGGVVTSKGVGMAVPDWPTSYGYNMFFFPISKWMGGIFYEHTHRLVASVVGLLVVLLTRWAGGRAARLPLAIIGIAELVSGILLPRWRPDLSGAGYFLSGIGGVVLLSAAIWTRNAAAKKPLPLLAWIAFGSVQIQGLLGGLRVVLYRDEIGIFHGALAQLFFVVVCAISFMSSRWWQSWRERPSLGAYPGLRSLLAATTLLILGQLILGATMRHEHSGLAIPDFPLAYQKLWPPTDPASIERYNQQRLEVTAVKPITAAQIHLQMAHRIVAAAILAGVLVLALRARQRLGSAHPFARLSYGWLCLICLQVLLGAATIWSNKAADIATAHVVVGALSLAMGAMLWFLESQELVSASKRAGVPAPQDELPGGIFAPRPSAQTSQS